MKRLALILGVWWGAGLLILGVTACQKAPEETVTAETPVEATEMALKLPSSAPTQTSQSCRACHAEIFEKWEGTDHANANQPVEIAELEAAFAAAEEVSEGGSTFRLEVREGVPTMVNLKRDGTEVAYPVHAALGQKPSRQMLVETETGRIQPTDMAWDPAKEEWFNVFGDENRHPGEWGHWTGRGMNWNSMCAHCHMTGYEKNYDAETDRYSSSWVEAGISCIQCHGPVPEGHGTDTETAGLDWIHDRQQAEQTCAYCHARNEQLTAEFPPGADYHDHFRLTLPVQEGVFYPDGQMLDEDFNWTSVKLSRMHHAGVSCMDCHDPHTSETILPVENNALCMQCHTAPGRQMPLTEVVAPVIDPTAHSRHAAGSTGNQCVSCHMPTTSYMMRSPRHDHGWFKPDPLMTKELGIPNACSSCHSDQSVDWAIKHTDDWYGEKMDSRQRARARAVASAQAGEESSVAALIKLWEDEDIPAWRATYLQLLASHADHHPEIVALARAATQDEDPMVRGAAIQALTGIPGQEDLIRAAFDDPVRLVRLDAAWGLSGEIQNHANVAKEFLAYLDLTLDQPGGRLRKGQYLANTGRLTEAVDEIKLATQWDRYSAGIHETHALVLQAAGRMPEAANAFYRAAQLQTESGEAMFRAGLAFAEAGKMEEATTALSTAVKRQPDHHRAWYNLGLLKNQSGDIEGALQALAKAEEAGPNTPDYPYAAATIYWQSGNREAARNAALRALQINPGYAPARRLLQ
ncbi:MAG: tetratricopeptide repeat protein [Synoicihabitans sp.]